MAYGYQVGCSLCVSMGPSHYGEHGSSDQDTYAQAVSEAASSGLPNTIDSILKSGKLTQAQIQAASLPNIMTLFTAPASQKEEFAHFLQRFILDGYVRGVDVVQIMKSGQRPWSIFIDEIGGSAIGEASGRTSVADRGVVRFDDEFWTDSQSYTKKLQLFYHEMGHAALARPHDDDGIMESGVNGKLNLTKTYEQMVNELFAEAQRGKGTATTSGGGIVPSGYTNLPGSNSSGGSSSTSGIGNVPSVPSAPSPVQAVPTTISMNIGGGDGTLTVGGIKMPAIGTEMTNALGSKTGPAVASFGNATPDTKVSESNVFTKTLKGLGAAQPKVG